MDFWEDKQITEILEILKSKQRKKASSTLKDSDLVAPRLIFVCGKQMHQGEESIREITIRQLERHKIRNDYGKSSAEVLCVISEKLYIQDLAEDIFVFEEMLAEISHKIIIVAESPGSYCELGAFLMRSDFVDKTVVINEDKLEYKDSFITKGPIKMLESKKEENVILHSGLEHIKDCTEYIYRMKEIAQENFSISINNDPSNLCLKSLIYEFANIVELFQPITAFEIEMLYKSIKGFERYTIQKDSKHKIKKLSKVILLMEMMGMIKKANGYYYMSEEISCYNIMFTISRKEYNDYRIKYLNRLDKLQPCRRRENEIM